MKRKILSLGLAAFLLLGILPLSGCGNDEIFEENVIQDTALENEVRQNVRKLSKKARENINYKELLEDVESVNNEELPIHAALAEREEGEYESRYDGKGYYCKTMSGGEVVTYVFYSTVGDKKIYSKDWFYHMSGG